MEARFEIVVTPSDYFLQGINKVPSPPLNFLQNKNSLNNWAFRHVYVTKGGGFMVHFKMSLSSQKSGFEGYVNLKFVTLPPPPNSKFQFLGKYWSLLMHQNLPPLFIYKHAHVLSYLVLFFFKFKGGEVTLFIGYSIHHNSPST